MNTPKKVLFVCLGNICRSPLAEALFINEVEKAGLNEHFVVDSCGTGNYHVGEQPDRRTIQNAVKYGIELKHSARQIEYQDLVKFDIILVMDKQNLADVKKLDTQMHFHHKIKLVREFDTIDTGADVPDPWFGGDEGFDTVFHIIKRCAAELFGSLREKY